MADQQHGMSGRERAGVEQTTAKSSSKALDDSLNKFWQNAQARIDEIDPETEDFKVMQLPLARIKRVMKLDEEVKMISAEAPAVFAMACELFIQELAIRGWNYTAECKRRTLQRADITIATSRSDMFDFLIDILPRDEGDQKRREDAMRASMGPDQIIQIMQQQMQEVAGQMGESAYQNMMMQQQSFAWQQWNQLQRQRMNSSNISNQQQDVHGQSHEVYHDSLEHQEGVEHHEEEADTGTHQEMEHHMHHQQSQHSADHQHDEGLNHQDESIAHSQHVQQGYQ